MGTAPPPAETKIILSITINSIAWVSNSFPEILEALITMTLHWRARRKESPIAKSHRIEEPLRIWVSTKEWIRIIRIGFINSQPWIWNRVKAVCLAILKKLAATERTKRITRWIYQMKKFITIKKSIIFSKTPAQSEISSSSNSSPKLATKEELFSPHHEEHIRSPEVEEDRSKPAVSKEDVTSTSRSTTATNHHQKHTRNTKAVANHPL